MPLRESPTLEWELLELRSRVRMLDTQLIVLLARRFDLVRQIREIKRRGGLPLFDEARERDVLNHCLDLADSLHVPSNIVTALYSACFTAARGERGGAQDAP